MSAEIALGAGDECSCGVSKLALERVYEALLVSATWRERISAASKLLVETQVINGCLLVVAEKFPDPIERRYLLLAVEYVLVKLISEVPTALAYPRLLEVCRAGLRELERGGHS